MLVTFKHQDRKTDAFNVKIQFKVMDSFEVINTLENLRAVEWVVFLFFGAQDSSFWLTILRTQQT